METHQIHSVADPSFAALIEIYSSAIPSSERKSIEQLSSMLQRPEYLFLVVSRENAVAGFAIAISFAGCDSCLLEYMAVAATHRSRGIGRYLFSQLLQRQQVSGRFLLVEVESDKAGGTALQAEAAKRKAFYRSLGCKEVEGLDYIMPPVSSIAPPAMNLLACRQELPQSIDKTHLRTWLQCTYAEVYEAPQRDPRLEQMLKDLPQTIRLI